MATTAADPARGVPAGVGPSGFLERLPPRPAPADGPLAGTRLAVKDMIAVAGARFTGGLGLNDGRRADADATVVRRLEAAGAAVVGMTVSDAAGLGTITPGVANPRYPGLCVGGSSGGSAAVVAAGLADVGLGTDSGGSIRIPAAATGLSAFKPTRGRVPMDGIMALAPSFDHPGVLARDPDLLAAAGFALLGQPPIPPAAAGGLADLRVGVAAARLAFATEAVAAACHRTLDRLAAHGATIVPLGADDRARLVNLHATVFGAEALAVHSPPWQPGHPDYPAVADRSLRSALALTAEAVSAARADLAVAGPALDRALRSVDVVLAPTLPGPPAPQGARQVRHRGRSLSATLYHIVETMPFNVSGSPVVVTPAGDGSGAVPPPSLQWVAATGEDARLLALLPLLAAIAH